MSTETSGQLPEPVFPSSEDLFTSEDIRPPVQDNTTIVEEPSMVSADTSIQSRPDDKTFNESQQPERPEPTTEDTANPSDLFASTFNDTMVDIPGDADSVYPKDLDDEPPSIAPLSVPPPSCDPASVAPASVPPPPCQLVSYCFGVRKKSFLFNTIIFLLISGRPV